MERFLHGGNIYKEPSPLGEWLDFSANINPLGLPDSARRAIIEQLDKIEHYPEPDAPKLKNALGKHYDLPVEQIILGNGASELFYLFFYTVRPKKVLIPVPSFGEYERAAIASGAEPFFLQLRQDMDFSIDLEELKSQLPGADCLILGNPNNPTGNLISLKQMKEIADICNDLRCWLLVDESFLDFRRDCESLTVRHMVQEYERLFVIQSMTKFYSIPGLRLGFGVAPPGLRESMEKGKDVWNVNLLAQEAGLAALADDDYAMRSRGLLEKEQSFMMDGLRRFKAIHPLIPTVNFMLLKCETSALANRILNGMKSRGILLRGCDNYRGLESGEYLRMAIRSRQENIKLLNALSEILQEENRV
ncbi:MAG TPA: threonine-phosphate decarboxylase [Selenomonas sp.]|nr:threonine-phosphate decarboxylase [Selenomonas sp.]